jgi:hypothetical protein
VQKCRLITSSQDAGITVLCVGRWDSHSSALGLQTQQVSPLRGAMTHHPNGVMGR